MNKKPMPLRDLPGNLQSARDEGEEYPDMGVVDMGRIVIKRKRSRFPLNIGIMLLAVCLGGVGIMTYNTMSVEQITVVVDVVDPQAIPTTIENSGGQIVSVEHKQGGIYEVKMSTRKNRSTLLELLQNNENVRSVKLKQ